MRTAAILARVAAGQAHAVTAADIFTSATTGGARALGRHDLGRITPGAKSDFVMVDITHPTTQPLYDPIRSLVYAAGERAIRHVFVGGQQVVRDGKALAFDYADASQTFEGVDSKKTPIPSAQWAWAYCPSGWPGTPNPNWICLKNGPSGRDTASGSP